MSRRVFFLWIGFLLSATVAAQEPATSEAPRQVLTLQRCRQLAMDNNKQLAAHQLGTEVAAATRKAAATKYLPHVSAMAGAEFFSREISILNNRQKNFLNYLGTNSVNKLEGHVSDVVADLVEQGILTAEEAQQLSEIANQMGAPIAEKGDEFGSSVRKAFRTNTHSLYTAGITVTQPIYMGGAISAANEMARISEQMAQNTVDNTTQNTLFAVDNAYWLAVSLKNKERLAHQYLGLVSKFNEDVHKYIREGVATRADGLKVDVAVNNAELQAVKVEDGVALSKMYLCQLCGLPIDGNILLADEERESVVVHYDAPSSDSLYEARPEVRLLQNAIDMSHQATKLTQSFYKPHIAIAGGLLVSNPNTYNGFERKFKDLWNIGILVQMPIWSWHEGRYKIQANRAATRMAELELADVREKISLQVEQSRFKVTEANKRLELARKNMTSAEENLRCANVGYREGVMTITEVMEAQTMWQQAKTQIIDAEVEVNISQVALQKALGRLE